MFHTLRIRLLQVLLASALTAGASLFAADAASAGSTNTSVPVRVAGLSGVTQVSAGVFNTCAVLGNGTVACWGSLWDGQTSAPGSRLVTAPEVVAGLGDVVRVSTSWNTTCAVKVDGTVWCWGYGPLGHGALSDPGSATPVQVDGLTGMTDVSVGNGGVACALGSTGTVWCWGDGRFGALNNGQGSLYGYFTNVAQPVLNLTDATSISVGQQHVCAVRSNQALACWGTGPGIRYGEPKPTPVNGLDGTFTQVSATTASTCAVDTAGRAWCIGDNAYAELGRPAAYEGPLAPLAGTPAVKAISVGETHSCLVDTGGGAWCAGRTDLGQGGSPDRGDGTADVAVRVVGLPALAVAVTVGAAHSCALLADGTVSCWGDDAHGQLGNGDAPLPEPTPPPAPPQPFASPAPELPAAAPAPVVTPAPETVVTARKTARRLYLSEFPLRPKKAGRCPATATLTIRRASRASVRMKRKVGVTPTAAGGCQLTTRVTLAKRLRGKALTIVVEGSGLRRLAQRVR